MRQRTRTMVPPRPGPNRTAGLTLVELLVAVAIGLFLVAVAAGTLVAARDGGRFQRAAADAQDALRMAMELIAQDLRTSGFTGCGAAVTLQNHLASPGTYLTRFNRRIEAYAATGAGWAPTPDPALPTASIDPASDILVVRHADGRPWRIVAHPPGTPPGANPIQIAAGNDIRHCDFVLASGCQAAVVFQQTSPTAASTGTLTHAGSGCTPGNAAPAALGWDFAPGTDQVVRVATTAWYVSPDASGRPRLVRQPNNGAVEVVADGIERLVLRFGYDADGDGTPDRFVRANDVADWQRVHLVQIALLAVSDEDNLVSGSLSFDLLGQTYTPTDRRLRRLLVHAVDLRNAR